MPYLTMGDLGADVDPGVWDNIANAITSAMTGEEKGYAAVSQADAAALVTQAQAETAAQEAAAGGAVGAAGVAKWTIPLLIGGAALVGFAIWRRSRRKRS